MRLSEHPRWIILGGCLLAFLSAAVNAAFLLRLGTSVSHLTGDVSRVAVDAFGSPHDQPGAVLRLLTATFGFVLGAAMSGFFIHSRKLETTRPYGRTTIAIGGLLLVAHFALPSLPVLSIALTSFACGMQNALATNYRGVILRTTHVTGLLTDLGSNLGMRVRGYEVESYRIGIPAALVLSYFAGAAFGGFLEVMLHAPSLLILSLTYVFGGTVWTIAKHGAPD